MKLLFATLLSLSLAPSLCLGQVGGNISYAQNVGRNRLGQPERTKRTLSLDELPPTSTSMFVEANVLMNVKAEEYVAVFAISQEGSTVAECGRKMDAVIQTFSDALKALGIKSSDLFVDFIAQNKIYGFDVTDGIAKEKLVGIELKKIYSFTSTTTLS